MPQQPVEIDSKILTLIICTYNRNDIIGHLFKSLQYQTADPKFYEVLIVNNYNNAHVHDNLIKMIESIDIANVINEPRTGLSIARNTGFEIAKTKWVGYVDDDCILPKEFISKALSLIRNDSFDCFGGHIKTIWLKKRPRWLMKNYGSKPYPIGLLKGKYSSVDISTVCDFFNWGGNMFFRKSIFEIVGGFEENIGMSGNTIGYSAENRIQMKMREHGFKIGYDPRLIIGHTITPNKFHLSWHLKAAYCEGRDARLIFPNQYSFHAIGKDLLRVFTSFLKSSCALVFDKYYFWENWVLDSFKPLFKTFGKLKSFTQ